MFKLSTNHRDALLGRVIFSVRVDPDGTRIQGGNAHAGKPTFDQMVERGLALPEGETEQGALVVKLTALGLEARAELLAQ